MKYYWVLNGAVLREFDNFEDAYRLLQAENDVLTVEFEENSLVISKTDVNIVCSEEFVTK